MREAAARLELRSLLLRVRLGVAPSERVYPRDVPLDLTWKGPPSPSGPLVDYGAVCERLLPLEGDTYEYVEDLARAALDSLCASFPGRWTVKVTKPFPPTRLRVGCASVTLAGGEGGDG